MPPIFRSDLFIAPRRKKNDYNLKNFFFFKTMVRTFCPTCVVTGYACRNYTIAKLENDRKISFLNAQITTNIATN